MKRTVVIKSSIKFFYLAFFIAVIFTSLSGCGLSQVPKKNKLKSNLYYRLGVGFYQDGNFIKAMQEFIKAKTLNPYSAKNYNAIGMVYLVTGREGGAIKSFNNAVRINPQFSDAYYNLAIIYMKRKDYTSAKAFLKKALKNPFYNRPYESYTQLARIYFAENKPEKAKKILIISELLDKKYFLTYYYLGKYYLVKGKLNKSLYNFKKAITLNMFFTPAKYYEGVIFFKQKRYNKAKKIFSYVYNQNKTDKYGIKSLDYLKKIILYSR
ncbi:MAG: tetratricopeptide repeat protein [bacterium]